MSRDKATLLDLAKASRLILQFTQDIDKVTFKTDLKTQSAVCYQIAILGEAVKRLSQEFREQNSDIPWTSIAGMRDKLVHDYDGINTQRLWLTVKISIPEFLIALEPFLPQEGE